MKSYYKYIISTLLLVTTSIAVAMESSAVGHHDFFQLLPRDVVKVHIIPHIINSAKVSDIKKVKLINKYFREMMSDPSFKQPIAQKMAAFIKQIDPVAKFCAEEKMFNTKGLFQGNLEIRNKPFYETPLIYIASRGKYALAETLIELGADVNAQGADGESALHHAACEGHLNIVELLIQHHANVNSQSYYGITPLMRAVLYVFFTDDTIAIVKCLIKNGANVNACDNIHRSRVLDHARYQASTSSANAAEIVRELIAAGAEDISTNCNEDKPVLQTNFNDCSCTVMRDDGLPSYIDFHHLLEKLKANTKKAETNIP